MARTTASSAASPGPVAITAGSTTATAARTSSGTASRRRAAVGTPSATTASRTAVADHGEKRCPGIRVPPGRSRCRRGLRGCPACPVRAPPARRTAGTPALRHRQRVRHQRGDEPRQRPEHRDAERDRGAQPSGAARPRRQAARQRDRRREQQPRRRQAGQRDPEQPASTRSRRRPASAVAAPRGHPRQAAVSDQQAPVALQKPFCDIGIPHGERRGDELARHARGGHRDGGQVRGTPAGQPQSRDQQHLDHHAAVDDVRQQRDREVLGQCPAARPRSTPARRRSDRPAAWTPRRGAADSPAPAAAPSPAGTAPARRRARPTPGRSEATGERLRRNPAIRPVCPAVGPMVSAWVSSRSRPRRRASGRCRSAAGRRSRVRCRRVPGRSARTPPAG